MSPMKDLFLKAIPELQILTEEADLQYFGKDVCQQFEAAPSLVLLPNTAEQVQNCIKVANLHSIAIVPSAGRTGYSAGATATKGEVILSVAKLNRILDLNEVERTVTVQAGVTLEAVQNYAKEQGLLYPVDFTSRGSCLIGGTIATNAGGTRVIRHGLTRDWVLGLKVVTGAGELLELNGSLIKNQTGLDLRQLFIGSEGTLGVVVEAILKLTTDKADRQLAFCAFNQVKDIPRTLLKLRQAGLEIELFEFMEASGLELVLEHHKIPRPFSANYPAYALIEIDSGRQNAQQIFEAELEKLIEEEVIADVALSESSKQYSDLMALRELIGETANQHYSVHKNDISVSVAAVPEFLSRLKELLALQAAEFKVVVFGHIGDGNLHINILMPREIERQAFWQKCKALDQFIFGLVKQFHGSISAEHGVGLLKKPYLTYSRTEAEIALMREIKKVFDPNAIMNPGKIF
jgi:FAD/FMN-containing dehydrogenase